MSKADIILISTNFVCAIFIKNMRQWIPSLYFFCSKLSGCPWKPERVQFFVISTECSPHYFFLKFQNKAHALYSHSFYLPEGSTEHVSSTSCWMRQATRADYSSCNALWDNISKIALHSALGEYKPSLFLMETTSSSKEQINSSRNSDTRSA